MYDATSGLWYYVKNNNEYVYGWENDTATGTLQLDVTTGEKKVEMSFKICDCAGNCTTKVATTYIDNKAPTKLNVTDTPTKWVNQGITTEAGGGVDNGVGNVCYKFRTNTSENSGNNCYLEGSASYTYSAEKKHEGTKKIRWWACDILGNCQNPDNDEGVQRTMKIDVTSPVIDICFAFNKDSTDHKYGFGCIKGDGKLGRIEHGVSPHISDNLSGIAGNLGNVNFFIDNTSGDANSRSIAENRHFCIESNDVVYDTTNIIVDSICDNAGNCGASSIVCDGVPGNGETKNNSKFESKDDWKKQHHCTCKTTSTGSGTNKTYTYKYLCAQPDETEKQQAGSVHNGKCP